MSGGRDRDRQTNTHSVDILGRAFNVCVCVLFVIPDTKKKKTNDERTNELALTKFNQLLTTFGFARPYLAQNRGCQLCA